MGIKRKEIVTYRDDRGCEHDMADMEPSHIINVIRHHTAQVDVLRRVVDRAPEGFLKDWINSIEESITLLTIELSKRNPNEVTYED